MFSPGSFFYEDERPDADFFRQQAEVFGFNTDAYLKALHRVPVFKRDYARSNVFFLWHMVSILAENGLKNLKLFHALEERRQAQERVSLLDFALDLLVAAQ